MKIVIDENVSYGVIGVDVNKSLTKTLLEKAFTEKKLRRSESGAEATIVQAANPNDHIFEITADYVNIKGVYG